MEYRERQKVSVAGGGLRWRVAGRQMKDRAKVQIGAELLCKGAKVNARVSSMEY
jgi:hypothetical protein